MLGFGRMFLLKSLLDNLVRFYRFPACSFFSWVSTSKGRKYMKSETISHKIFGTGKRGGKEGCYCLGKQRSAFTVIYNYFLIVHRVQSKSQCILHNYIQFVFRVSGVRKGCPTSLSSPQILRRIREVCLNGL